MNEYLNFYYFIGVFAGLAKAIVTLTRTILEE